MGHNFGMKHDNAETNEGKCKGGRHIMLGASTPWSTTDTPWSKCSRSDFERHYAAKKWGGSCLEDIREINVGHDGRVNASMILYEVLHKIGIKAFQL